LAGATGGGIEDGLGEGAEVAQPHGGGGDGAGDALGLVDAAEDGEIGEEERAVFSVVKLRDEHGAAEVNGAFALAGDVGDAGVEAAGVEDVVAEEEFGVAVEFVGAGLGGHDDDAGGGAAELGGGDGGFDAELTDAGHGRSDGEGRGDAAAVVVGDAVDEDFGGVLAATGDDDIEVADVAADTGDEPDEGQDVAIGAGELEGDLIEEGSVYDGAKRRGFGLEEGEVGGD